MEKSFKQLSEENFKKHYDRHYNNFVKKWKQERDEEYDRLYKEHYEKHFEKFLFGVCIKKTKPMSSINTISQRVIDYSLDNSSGTLLSKTAIKQVVSLTKREINKGVDVGMSWVDNQIMENESVRGGYLVKASDFLTAVKQ